MNFKHFNETPELYKEIILGESVPHDSIKTKVFVDMDGVLCDLRKVIANYKGEDPYLEQSSKSYDEFFSKHKNQIKDIFANIPKFESSDYLIQLITDVAGKYFICTAPLKSDPEESIKGKAQWLEHNLLIPPEAIIYDRNKYHYAQDFGTPNILIDDLIHNINQWEDAGGIGIHYSANEQDLGVVVVEGLEKALIKLKQFA